MQYAGLTPQTLSPCNLYYEVLQAVYANALAKLVVAGTAFTAGVVVDQTKYAGGTPQINVTAITGSGLVTVTGTAFNPATQQTVAGVTWTATASSTSVIALTPGTAPSNSLIGAVSAISVAAGITAGTIYVEAARPTGRPLLP